MNIALPTIKTNNVRIIQTVGIYDLESFPSTITSLVLFLSLIFCESIPAISLTVLSYSNSFLLISMLSARLAVSPSSSKPFPITVPLSTTTGVALFSTVEVAIFLLAVVFGFSFLVVFLFLLSLLFPLFLLLLLLFLLL